MTEEETVKSFVNELYDVVDKHNQDLNALQVGGVLIELGIGILFLTAPSDYMAQVAIKSAVKASKEAFKNLKNKEKKND